MDNLAIDEILNGYQSLLNIRAPFDRTKYPYNQLLVANVKFTQNNIEIIARNIDNKKKSGDSHGNKQKSGDSHGNKQKSGGGSSIEKTLVYG
jgi:hypothetical protein